MRVRDTYTVLYTSHMCYSRNNSAGFSSPGMLPHGGKTFVCLFVFPQFRQLPYLQVKPFQFSVLSATLELKDTIFVYQGYHMLPPGHVKPANHIFSNCCSCNITGQRNTLERKCYPLSSTYTRRFTDACD